MCTYIVKQYAHFRFKIIFLEDCGDVVHVLSLCCINYCICYQVQIFLRDSWLNTLRTAIRSSLLDVGKGWFNMEQRNWEVYQISKLAKFMQLVKFAMQVQSTIYILSV